MVDLPLARRSFLSRFGSGFTVLGAALTWNVARAQAQSAASGRWQPSRHPQDDWLDELPGKHRFLLDTTTTDGLGEALLYTNNYFLANQNSYGLTNTDLAVVIVVRHFSTVFAYNDAIWMKYGGMLASRINFNDPQTKQPPKLNVYNSPAHVGALPSFGTTLDSVLKRGVQLAVCQMATRFFAAGIAEATGGNADNVYKELAANLVSNSHLVPAGIVAINRAQERGYAFAKAG
jgi:intracellular sulfur oxidation DsrE/DsrF family protein